MSLAINANFSIQDFNTLENTAKRAIYKEANETHNVNLVRQLNDFGMKPNIPSCSGPTIISCFMDIATKNDVIFGFLKELRQTNRLLTKQEFQSLPAKKWVQKSELSRIAGCDHLMQKITENQLTQIKVPLKIAVVEDIESLKVKGWYYSGNIYNVASDQIKIYAQEIKSVDRKLARKEIDELIQVIAAANFVDLWPENILLAEDGIYFIDTEAKSFADSIRWEKMGRFESLIAKEDVAYFQEKVKEKMKDPETITEDNNYNTLTKVKTYNERHKSSAEEDTHEMKEIKHKISALEYVGAEKAGTSWLRPNNFSFDLKDLLT